MTPTPPTTGANYIDIMTYGMFHSSDHTGMDALVGGRTAITTEAVVAYNDLRRFAGLAPTTIENVGRWAFANALTNNAQASGNDLQGVGLYYAMQGAKVGWIADAKYTPRSSPISNAPPDWEQPIRSWRWSPYTVMPAMPNT